MPDQLALHGGKPVRTQAWPSWPEWGAPETAALQRVLASGSWGGFPSPNTEARAFSEAFARYVETDFAVPCVNGTFSLMLALQAARVSRGAEVITTAYSFVGTLGGIVAAGCTPVLVDVLPDTYCIDPDQAEAAVTERTEAILPVHLASSMADMDRLREICSARGLLLVEDCAHAHGMRWRDRPAGSIGDLGSFSMQSTKLLTAGEGGAVTTSNPSYEGRLQALINCGRRETPRARKTEPLLGHNLRLTEWQAAILCAQLERLPDQHRRRSLRVRELRDGLAQIPGISFPEPDPRLTHPTHYQVILRYAQEAFAGVPRDEVVAALQAEGVPCEGDFYLPLNEDPLWSRDPRTNPAAAARDYEALRFPVARRAAREEALWLPHEIFLGSQREVTDILSAFEKVQRLAGQIARNRPLQTRNA